MSLDALLKALAEIRVSVRQIAGGMVAEWGFKTVFFTYQYNEVLYAEARRYVIAGEHVHFTWRELHSVVEIIAFFTE